MSLADVRVNSFPFVDELFYTPSKAINEQEKKAALEGQEAVHCLSVLRHKIGDSLYITNGEGRIYKGLIISAKKSSLTIDIHSKYVLEPPKPKLPILVIGSLKNKERIEWLVEKTTELGIQEIHIVQTTRSERFNVNIERLNLIAIAAMKQSKQAFLPTITTFPRLDVSVYQHVAVQVVAHEKVDEKSLLPHQLFENNTYLESTEPIVYWIGPEGGFTNEEIHLLTHSTKASLLWLGNTRLRAETAALSVIQTDAIRRLKLNC